MNTKLKQSPGTNPNLMISCEKDGKVIYSNEAGEPLLHEWGVEVGEKIPSSIRDLMQKIISQKNSERMEVKVGKSIYLIVFHPLPEQECVSIFGFDITEQKELEENLRESENKYRNIVETSVEGIWIFNSVSETTYVNEKMAEMLGYNREEMIGRFIWDFAYEEDKGVFQVKLANRKLGIDEVYELKLMRRDGSPLWVSVSAKGFLDKNGKFAGSLGMFTDITDRKRAEEEVKSASNMLQIIMNNIPQGIFWKDRNSVYLGCNKVFANAAGLESPENIVGKTDYDLPWLPEQTEWFLEYDRRIMESATPEYHIVEPQRTADGKLAWIETNKIPLHDAKGNVTGILGTYEDITERKRMEEQTRQRVEELETLMDVVPVAIFIGHDSKCHNITGNKMANELYEAKLGENVSANVSHLRRLFHKNNELTASELPMQKAAFKDIDVRNEELDLLLPGGEWRGLLGSASPLHDSEGNVRGSVGAFVDITERKKTEAKLEETLENLENLIKERTVDLQKAYNSLKESERGLAEAQEMAHIGNWEWDIAIDKAYWSEEMYRIFKRDPQKLAPSLDEYLSYIHPDDLDYYCKVNDYTRKVRTSGLDFRIVLANGEERTLHIKSEFIFNDENIPIRVKGIVQDITESKKAGEKIRYLANIVESSLDAIGTISLDGIVTSWNKGAERIYGYSAKEILGKHVSILSPSHLDKETLKLIELIKQGESYHQYETLRLGKDGKKIYVSITCSPVFDNNGKLTAISIIGRDITESKRAEETLRNFEIARKKEIHHRIKNNLQVISSLLDLEAEFFKGRKNITDSEVLKAFKESIDRVISIAFIHEELYKGKNIEFLNFSQYMKELAENLLLTYRLDTDVNLEFDLEENIFLDMDTAIPLGIIVNELVSNSLKYAFNGRDKGEIQIQLHRGESESDESTLFALTVSDNGVGIPENIDIEDLGSLGLQLVTSLVDQLDGELEMKRNNGTEFTVRFTVTENDDQASAPVAQQPVL